MATKSFDEQGDKFVSNNYAAILQHDEAPKDFHLIQDFLAHNEINCALTRLDALSATQVLAFWKSASYNDGDKEKTPTITVSYQGQTHIIYPLTVRKALHLPEHPVFDKSA